MKYKFAAMLLLINFVTCYVFKNITFETISAYVCWTFVIVFSLSANTAFSSKIGFQSHN